MITGIVEKSKINSESKSKESFINIFKLFYILYLNFKQK